MVAHALGLDEHDVVVECRRMGGGFGGKETQTALFACVAALLARAHGARRSSCGSTATTTCCSTGKRHAFVHDYDVGFDDDGPHPGARPHDGVALRLLGRPVRPGERPRGVPRRQRVLPARRRDPSRTAARPTPVSNTAFRGFGGPQGMIAIEAVIDDIARALGRDPLDVRKAQPLRHDRAQRHATTA